MANKAFEKFESDSYKVRHGKIRDVVEYTDAHGDEGLLLIASDRVSAFDVVMPTLIPGKGKILTQISERWFHYFKQVPNAKKYLMLNSDFDKIQARICSQHKTKVIPIEFIVRGYMAGSFWNDSKRESADSTYTYLCTADGLQQCEELPEPIFTPATKAPAGEHDENISFEQSVQVCADFLGWSIDAASQFMKALRQLSLRIYSEARAHAITKGIIIADTKFEFGMLDDKVVLIDELLTPDSSRFWSLAEYEIGRDQNSLDKQILRNYLLGLIEEGKWTKDSPPPELPDEIVERIISRYKEINKRLFE